MTPHAPDYAEPVVGWRVWLVAPVDGALRLRSVLYPTVWRPRRPHAAQCAPGRGYREAHVVPHARCGCGIYAAADVGTAVDYFDGYAPDAADAVYRVIGRVNLWGTVIESDRGWRAARAYPERLFVPARSLDGVTDATATDVAFALTAYGVPVEFLDGFTKRRVAQVLPPLAA